MNAPEVVRRLELAHKRWCDLRAQMVGWLYPPIVTERYVLPLQRKIAQLKYDPRFRGVDFYAIWREVRGSK